MKHADFTAWTAQSLMLNICNELYFESQTRVLCLTVEQHPSLSARLCLRCLTFGISWFLQTKKQVEEQQRQKMPDFFKIKCIWTFLAVNEILIGQKIARELGGQHDCFCTFSPDRAHRNLSRLSRQRARSSVQWAKDSNQRALMRKKSCSSSSPLGFSRLLSVALASDPRGISSPLRTPRYLDLQPSTRPCSFLSAAG